MATQIQAQVSGARILGPIPVRIYLRFPSLQKKKDNARLIRLQWDQPYSLRDLYVPVIKKDPSLESGDVAILEVWKERREWISEERKIKAPESATRTIIKLYKPKNPETKPKAVFVAIEYPLRSTRMGGYDNAKLISDDGVMWSYVAENVSRSGNHGKRLIMVVSTKPIMIRWVSVSNRGNKRSGIDVYDFDGVKSLPEYEELEVIKTWSYGKVVKMRDNLKNETFTALVLEFHEARKTCARTTHSIEPENAVELIQSSAHGAKTHWVEIYKVRAPCKVRTIRITGRGNQYEEVIEVSP